MSNFTVISGVTKTLAGLLNTATGVNVERDKAPDGNIPDTSALIHLYLFRVEVNPFFTNNDWLAPDDTTLVAPPIGLNLLYLITPYGPSQAEIQVTLGEVIKVFHDTPIIPPAAFDPSLAGTTEELRVLPRQLELQQMVDFWRAFEQRSYRLSVVYEVSAVLIDSELARTVRRVDERQVSVETLR